MFSPAHALNASRIRKAGLFGLLAALTSGFGQTFFIGLFGAEFRGGFGLDSASLGLLYGTATITSGLLMFWLGEMADRLPLGRATVVALGLLAAGCLMVGGAHSVWLLWPGLFLLRLGGQGLVGHLAVVAAARYATRNRGRSVAMASYGFILAEASFPILVAGLLGWLDWRTLWLLAGGVIILAAMPGLLGLSRLLAPPRPEPRDPDAPAPVTLSRKALLSDPGFFFALPVVLVSAFVVTAVFLHQGTLAEIRGWTLGSVARAFVLFAAFQAVAAFITGRLVDAFGSVVLMRFYLLPLAVGMVALGFLPAGPALWILFAGLGITAGANGVVVGAVWAELFGILQLGMIRGVFAAFMVSATAISPVALGLALTAGVELSVIALVTAAWCMVVPQLVVPMVRRRERWQERLQPSRNRR